MASRPDRESRDSPKTASLQKEPQKIQPRSKVSRACDICKIRKTKCDGRLPCGRCKRMSKSCRFTTTDGRLREQTTELAVNSDSELSFDISPSSELPHAGSQLPLVPRSRSPDPFSLNGESIYNSISEMETTEIQEATQSSSHSIFNRVQDNLQSTQFTSGQTSIHCFGDPVLPEIDTHFFALPSLENAREMVARYFEFNGVSSSFLHRPAINAWTEDYFSNFNATHFDPEEKSKKAILLMVLASSYVHMSNDTDDSLRYFLAAEQQLKGEMGKTHLTSIQARLLQCYYLLARSRIHQGYSIFGTVVTFIHVAGLHRKHTRDEAASSLEIEYRRRVFWSAFTLDKYMASVLGRPQKLPDDDHDQEFPSLLADDLYPSIALCRSNEDPKLLMGAAAFHPQIAVLIGKILKDLYGLRPLSLEARLEIATKHSSALDSFHRNVEKILDPKSLSGDYSTADFRRKTIGLSLALSHTQLLLHRPFLLASSVNQSEAQRTRVMGHIESCLKAALRTSELVNTLYQKDKIFVAEWFAHFCGYSAAVIFYVYVIQSQGQPQENWSKYLNAAETLRSQIFSSARTESFASKCSQVLVELSFEVKGHIQSSEKSDMRAQPNFGNLGTSSGTSGQTGVFGIPFFGQGSMIGRIDQWGFSSLTGY